MRSALFLVVLGALAVTRGHAQDQAPVTPWRAQWTMTRPSPSSTLLQLPGGQLEILGLRRWTPDAIQDSLEARSPGESVTSQECARALRRDLHFAEVFADHFPEAGNAPGRVVIAVVEPQDSIWVRQRALPLDPSPARRQAPWTALVDLVASRPNLVPSVVLGRTGARLAGRKPEVPSFDWSDSTYYHALWAELDAHRSPADLADAERVLATAPYVYDRLAALALLSNFAETDAAWRAIVGAVLEEDGPTRGLALPLIGLLSRESRRSIDWAPAADDLRAALDGASLGGLTTLLGVLVATKVDPALAGPLLKGAGHGVLMYAGAQHPAFRDPALAFLRQISGKDFGRDLVKWQAWVDAL